MPLKRYSNKEPLVLLWVMLPYIIFLNTWYSDLYIQFCIGLFKSTFTALYISVIYFLFGVAAMLVKKRFRGGICSEGLQSFAIVLCDECDHDAGILFRI
jgi:hypothetical protein